MHRLRRVTFVATAVALLAAAPSAHADLAQLKAACQPAKAEDAPAYTYRFCDDGVPGFGGRTANPTADRAVAVPAAYAGVEGLPAIDAAAAAAVPGNANGMVALDVDISMPDPARVPPPPGGYPLMAMMHGCCSGSKRSWESTKLADGGEKWHYNSAWFASRGYVVITYTARGFVDGNNHGSTGETHIDSLQFEINDFQHLAAQVADDPFFNVDPSRVVATGGSYGGGFSWLALTDPLWRSPGGKNMRLAAIATKYGWTDLLASLVPTGRHFYDEGPLPATDGTDSGYTPPGTPPQKVGIPIRSIVQALFLSGDLGFPSPPPNNPHTTFPQDIRDSYTCTASAYPVETNPLCGPALTRFIPESVAFRSAYYRNAFFEKVRTDPGYRVPVYSAGTLTDPLFPPVEHRRMAERLRAAYPDYPIQEHYGDYQHFAQNKAREWGDTCGEDHHVCKPADHPNGDLDAAPASRVRVGTTTMLNRFLDHHVVRPGAARAPEPKQDVTATLQVCPQNAVGGQRPEDPGPSFTASTFDGLTPGELTLRFEEDRTTTSTATPNTHAVQADPVFNTARNGSRCPVHTDPAGPGVASWDSEPLAQDATMIGGGILTVEYRPAGDLESLQLNARLYDVLEDGTALMVDRGPRRIDPRRDGTEKLTYQLHGNAWRFAKGHRIRLELAQDDDPYLHRSDPASSIAISRAQLVLPVRETAFGRDEDPAGLRAARPRVRFVGGPWASSLGTSTTFRVGWRAAGEARSYRVEVRRPGSSRWRVLTRSTTQTSLRVRGRAGRTYSLRVRATDASGRSGGFATTKITVPLDERAARFRRGRSSRSENAWRWTLTACGRGCSARIGFKGGELAIIGVRPRRSVVLVVRIDGRTKRFRIRGGRPAARQVLATVRAKRGRRHVAVLRPQGALTLDAFGAR